MQGHPGIPETTLDLLEVVVGELSWDAERLVEIWTADVELGDTRAGGSLNQHNDILMTSGIKDRVAWTVENKSIASQLNEHISTSMCTVGILSTFSPYM